MPRVKSASRSAAARARARQMRTLAETGVPAVMAASALAVALTASSVTAVSHAAGIPARALATVLTSSDSTSPLQSALEQLSAAQQQIQQTNSDYPFITPFDQTLLPQYTQDMASSGLNLLTGVHNAANSYDPDATTFPYMWTAPGTDPVPILNTGNADEIFHFTFVGPETKNVLTITPGPGTQDFSFTVSTGNGVTQDFKSLQSYDLSQFTANANGTYTVVESPAPQPGNWINTSGADLVLTRDTMGDWGLPHDSISFSTPFTLPVLSDSQITSLVSTLAQSQVAANASPTLSGLQHLEDTIPAGHFTDISATIAHIEGGPILLGQLGAFGHYSLEPDQALIVKVPTFDAGYSSIQINDNWTMGAPDATVSGNLNDTNTFNDPDGFTYYVVSSHDPGVANWLDDSGISDGNLFLRWQNVTGSVPTTPIQAQVVNVADVRNDLPSDTPLVTPAERAADFQERLLEFDYRQDQSHDPGWVTANLEHDQIKSAIISAVGADEFNKLFGGQQDVPSVLDRMTDSALIPNMATVAHDIAANPQDSLSAIVQNLPLAVKDIELPQVLAALHLEMIVGKTFQAIDSDIASDQLSQAMTAFETGVQQLGTAFNQMWTDPATSITAGFLNARDDLAVSIMNADSYSALASSDFTSISDQLTQFGQSVEQMLSAGSSYLLDPSGADLAP